MRAVLLALILLAIILVAVGWRPRTPDDCAHCRLASTGSTA